jgi:hypothetical protein
MAQEQEDPKRPGELLGRLTAERRRQNRIRSVLAGGVFGLFVIFAVSIIHQFRTFDSVRLEVKMNARASASLWPIVSEELDRLIPKAIPALDKAMLAESESMLPKFNERLAGEIELFDEALNQRGDAYLDAAMAEAFSSRGIELDRFRSALHADPVEADKAYEALLERARGWARSEMDHLLDEPASFLETLHEATTEMESDSDRGEALKDALMVFIQIAHGDGQAGG